MIGFGVCYVEEQRDGCCEGADCGFAAFFIFGSVAIESLVCLFCCALEALLFFEGIGAGGVCVPQVAKNLFKSFGLGYPGGELVVAVGVVCVLEVQGDRAMLRYACVVWFLVFCYRAD